MNKIDAVAVLTRIAEVCRPTNNFDVAVGAMAEAQAIATKALKRNLVRLREEAQDALIESQRECQKLRERIAELTHAERAAIQPALSTEQRNALGTAAAVCEGLAIDGIGPILRGIAATVAAIQPAGAAAPYGWLFGFKFFKNGAAETTYQVRNNGTPLYAAPISEGSASAGVVDGEALKEFLDEYHAEDAKLKEAAEQKLKRWAQKEAKAEQASPSISNDSAFIVALDGYMDAVTIDERNTDRRVNCRLAIFAAADAWKARSHTPEHIERVLGKGEAVELHKLLEFISTPGSVYAKFVAPLRAALDRTAPASAARAPNFCATCGKRLHADSIHTCTPPGDAPAPRGSIADDAEFMRLLSENVGKAFHAEFIARIDTIIKGGGKQ